MNTDAQDMAMDPRRVTGEAARGGGLPRPAGDAGEGRGRAEAELRRRLALREAEMDGGWPDIRGCMRAFRRQQAMICALQALETGEEFCRQVLRRSTVIYQGGGETEPPRRQERQGREGEESSKAAEAAVVVEGVAELAWMALTFRAESTRERQMGHFWKAMGFVALMVVTAGVTWLLLGMPRDPEDWRAVGVVVNAGIALLGFRQFLWHFARFRDLAFEVEWFEAEMDRRTRPVAGDR